MKVLKCVLATAIIMGPAASGAETLEDAFKNGTFGGELRFVYTGGSDSNVPETMPVGNANVGSMGAEVNYETDAFHGFKMGLGAQAALDLEFHDEDGSSEDDARNSVTAAHLHNAYLQYGFSHSDIKVGRQTIKLPMMMNSSAFALEDYFEAAVVTLGEIPNTTIKLIYVNKWKKRYGSDSSGSFVQEDVHYDDGLYSLYFKNKSIEGLSLDGQYITTDDDDNNGDPPVFSNGAYDQYYVRGDYKLPTDHPLFLGLTYGGAEYDSTDSDTDFYGIKLGTVLAGTRFDLAYTTVDDEASFPGTLGHVPDAILYTAMLTNQSMFAGVEGYSLQVIPNFGLEELSTRFKVAYYSQSDEGVTNSQMDLDGATEFNIDIKYSLDSILKGLGTRLWAGYGQYDQDVDEDNLLYGRFYLTYTF